MSKTRAAAMRRQVAVELENAREEHELPSDYYLQQLIQNSQKADAPWYERLNQTREQRAEQMRFQAYKRVEERPNTRYYRPPLERDEWRTRRVLQQSGHGRPILRTVHPDPSPLRGPGRYEVAADDSRRIPVRFARSARRVRVAVGYETNGFMGPRDAALGGCFRYRDPVERRAPPQARRPAASEERKEPRREPRQDSTCPRINLRPRFPDRRPAADDRPNGLFGGPADALPRAADCRGVMGAGLREGAGERTDWAWALLL